MRLFNRSKVRRGNEVMPQLFIKADGGVACVDLDKRGQFVLDVESRMAWGISYAHRKKFDGDVVQIICEESCAPQATDSEAPWTSDRIPRTVGECYDDAMYRVREADRKQTMGGVFTTISLIFAVTIVVLIVAGLIQSGKLSI